MSEDKLTRWAWSSATTKFFKHDKGNWVEYKDVVGIIEENKKLRTAAENCTHDCCVGEHRVQGKEKQALGANQVVEIVKSAAEDVCAHNPDMADDPDQLLITMIVGNLGLGEKHGTEDDDLGCQVCLFLKKQKREKANERK